MAITAALVKELRERTGAGMMECKKALVETGGDIDAAIEAMRKSGQAKAAKKAGRTAADGVVVISVAPDAKSGVMVEVNSETDFTGRSAEFQALVKDVAMHVAASNPRYLDESEIPAATVDKQAEIFRAQQADSGKPPHIVDRIVEGKLKKWKKEICLVDQPFVRDPDKSMAQHVSEVAVTNRAPRGTR